MKFTKVLIGILSLGGAFVSACTASGSSNGNGSGGSGSGGASATGGTANKASSGGSGNGGVFGSGGEASGGATTRGGAGGNGSGDTGSGGTSGTGGTGGKTGAGGSGSGGISAGGSKAGSGGSSAGTGGAATGGQATGGAATGGQATGGAATGGQATGGAAMGGQATGGAATGGGGSASCGAGTSTSNDVVVNMSDVHQKMDGFGAADVWMSALTDAQADTFFDQTKGIGLSILRVGIDTSGNDLSQWSNAQKAAARGAIVWGAPWSPPANDKDNNSTTNGGHLLAADYDAWATTLAGFAAKLKSNAGVTLYGISAQNEPDWVASYDSCIYSAAQMVAFVKVLGPMLHALNPPVKLLAPEPGHWDDLWGGADNFGTAIHDDAGASSAVDIFATHDYVYNPIAPPAGVNQPIWETEVSGISPSPYVGPSADIGNGVSVATWVHNAIVTGGASAWHYWWLISLNNDNEGLLLQGGGTTKRLYTVGNFSKFVRPGYQRVGTSGAVPSGVQLTAYKNSSDGTVVVVAINSNNSQAPLSVFLSGGAPCNMTPWVTSSTDDLAAKSGVAVSGSRFTFTLGAQSVTTFVGK
jgi:glucuronoarabinoxylan endo-1,4-beta-xylanase